MNKKPKHDKIIDEYDLNQITTKVYELNKIITWLSRLKLLDNTIDQSDITQVIKHVKAKKTKLELKAKKATEDLIEEAELIASVYKDEEL